MNQENKPLPSLVETIGVKGVIAGALTLAVAITLAMCRPEQSTESQDTVGVVPEQTTTTLIEFVPFDTDPPDPTAEPTVPPTFLFGGDPCSALTALDFSRTIIDGVTVGTLIDFSPLSDDACGYLVSVGEFDYNITVQAVDRQAFIQPPAEGEDRVALTDIGIAAYGVALNGEYSVWVQVTNGYFVVISPDQASATDFAILAARRANDPADNPVPTSPATTVVVP